MNQQLTSQNNFGTFIKSYYGNMIFLSSNYLIANIRHPSDDISQHLNHICPGSPILENKHMNKWQGWGMRIYLEYVFYKLYSFEKFFISKVDNSMWITDFHIILSVFYFLHLIETMSVFFSPSP